MVLAPFFFAFGAFGGGLFVASPCVMGVVVLGVSGARAAGVVRRRSVLGVCAQSCGAAVSVLPTAGRVGAPAAAAALRRFAEALRGGRRGPTPPRVAFC